ncbi:hypothetical protein SteCoe_24897 [Stentor coeruleus]|uniref:Uncharacterized protein n=1 Tax=Stentor coeruleus TaxID=5963 RepID=A0A1R2BGI7_9CILI|nr:hypothetical protein SteCoe_24897 [Stentor coeruleus]
MKSDMSLTSITNKKSNKGRKIGKASMLASFFVNNKNQKLKSSKFIDDKTKTLIRKFFKNFSNEKKYELPYQDFKKLCENEKENLNTNRRCNLMRHALSFHMEITTEFIKDLKSLDDFEMKIEEYLKIKYIRSDKDKNIIFTMLLDEIENYIKAGVGKYKKPEVKKIRVFKRKDDEIIGKYFQVNDEEMTLDRNKGIVYEDLNTNFIENSLTIKVELGGNSYNEVCEKQQDEGEREKTTDFSFYVDDTFGNLISEDIEESNYEGERKKATVYEQYFENIDRNEDLFEF